jgi:AraC family L-rhamnose operon regulatory protein RhaS
LRSVGYWDARHEQRWGLPVHRNEGIEVSFLASGQLSASIENQPQQLRHDEFLITRPWQPHRLGNPNVGAGKLIWVIVDVGVRRPHQPWRWPAWVVLSPEDVAALTRFLRQNEQFIWPGTADLRRCFLGVAQAVEKDRASLLAVMINELLLVLLEMFRERKIPLRTSLTSSARTVRLFLDELQTTLDQPWTVETMAESCHLGVTQFVHYCEKLTNMSPAQYLRHGRIAKARAALTGQPERSITEIALDSGFSSSQYFTNVFRAETGQTPRAYRRRIQSR